MMIKVEYHRVVGKHVHLMPISAIAYYSCVVIVMVLPRLMEWYCGYYFDVAETRAVWLCEKR